MHKNTPVIRWENFAHSERDRRRTHERLVSLGGRTEKGRANTDLLFCTLRLCVCVSVCLCRVSRIRTHLARLMEGGRSTQTHMNGRDTVRKTWSLRLRIDGAVNCRVRPNPAQREQSEATKRRDEKVLL